MLPVLRTLVISFLLMALFVSVAVNFYYYTTATSLNNSLRREIGYGTGFRNESPLDVLEISRTRPIIDLYVREVVRIQDENQELRNTLRQVRRDNQQLRITLEQVRTELSNAEQSGGLDAATLIQLLLGF